MDSHARAEQRNPASRREEEEGLHFAYTSTYHANDGTNPIILAAFFPKKNCAV